MKKIILIRSVSALCILFSFGNAHAEIYKCVNLKGATVYHDKPCSIKEKETQMRAVKDPLNGYVPPPLLIDNVATGNESGTKNHEQITNGGNSKYRKEKPVSQHVQGKGLNLNQGSSTIDNTAKNISTRSSVGNSTQQASNGNEIAQGQGSSNTQAERKLASEIANNPEKFTTH